MGLSWQLSLMSLAAGLAGNFQLGYLAAVLSQPYVAIERHINSSWTDRLGSPITANTLSIIMSALNIVNPIAQMMGQMVALYICDKVGRKRAAIYGCFIIFPGCLLSMAAKYLSPAIELLFIGRLLWSLADGILVVNQTIWLIEAAPAKYRGSVASMQEVFASLGSLATQAFGVPFSTDELWPLMFVCPMVINVFCIVIFLIVYESPQFLLSQRNAPDEARKAIAAYHNLTNKDQIEEQFQIVKMNGSSSADKKGTQKVNGMDIMFRPWIANDDVSCVLRYGAWIGVMVKIAFVFTGTRIFRAFGTFVLNDMGGWSYLDARYASLAMGILRVPATFIPVFFIDRIGRRPLLIWSTAASVLCLVLIMLSIIVGESLKIGTLAGALLLQTVNVIGLGSLSRFYGAELVPKKLLLKSVSTLAIIEAMIRVIPEFAFYPLAHSIGGYYFLVFIIPTIFFLLFICYYCPETKGKTVNEVLNVMARRKGLEVKFHIADAKHDLSAIVPQASDLPIVIAMKQWGITVTNLKPRMTQSCKVRSLKKHRNVSEVKTHSSPV
uniref:Major facilitator superfamily (MFS) profile domain-containing protein n=1 Tax=Plectus sambesii TaxID=2011161 RepID=A0A914WSK5_9BILA